MAAHIKNCLFQILECPNRGCARKLQRKNFDDHARSCSFRLMACEYCQSMVAVIALQRHVLFRCVLVPMACTQGCSKQVPKQEMEQHINNDCPLTPLPCLLANTGCKEMIPRQELKSHIEKNIVQHLLALNEQMKQKDEVGAGHSFLGNFSFLNSS